MAKRKTLYVILAFFLIFILIGVLMLCVGFPMEILNKPLQAKLTFSCQSGFYSENVDLGMQSDSAAGVIRYTTDGSTPDTQSEIYSEPVKMELPVGERDVSAKVVKAAVFEGNKKSEVHTATFFLGKNVEERFTMPVISITTDSENLYGYHRGIYVGGKLLEEWAWKNPGVLIDGKAPANYMQRGREWEVPVTFELFESDGTPVFDNDAGMRVFGGWSRMKLEKSLRLISRTSYDPVKDRFYFEPVPGAGRKKDGKPIKDPKQLLLRNGGSDAQRGLFRDDLVSTLVQDKKLVATQMTRPAALFINGEYHGVRMIREPMNETYLETHFDIAPKDSAIISRVPTYGQLVHGTEEDLKDWDALLGFIASANLSVKENYSLLEEKIDMDQMIEYLVVQTYIGNWDWPINNFKSWRYKTTENNRDAPYGMDGRWRFLLFDTDCSFNYCGMGPADHDPIHELIKERTTHNLPLFRDLMKNEIFRYKFANRYADYINTCFAPENVLKTIDTMVLSYASEAAWNFQMLQLKGDPVSSLEVWTSELNRMREFAKERPEGIYQAVKTHLGATGTCTVKVEAEGEGTVQLNSLQVEDSFQGVYFTGVPLELSAKPQSGYRLSHWLVNGETVENAYEYIPSGDTEIKAVFEKDPDSAAVMINEVSCSKDLTPDWIEIYNAGTEEIRLSDYALSDDGRQLVKWGFPKDAVLKPGEQYLVYCDGKNMGNHANFKLSNGEAVYLVRKREEKIVDQIGVSRTGRDASYGRMPDGGNEIMYMVTPTPGKTNAGTKEPPVSESRLMKRIVWEGVMTDWSPGIREQNGESYVAASVLDDMMKDEQVTAAAYRENLAKSGLYQWVKSGNRQEGLKEGKYGAVEIENVLYLPAQAVAEACGVTWVYLKDYQSFVCYNADWIDPIVGEDVDEFLNKQQGFS